MIPSLVKRLSKSLSFGKSNLPNDAIGNKSNSDTPLQSTIVTSDNVSVLRRQPTKQLVAELEEDVVPSSRVVKSTSTISSTRSVKSTSTISSTRSVKSVSTLSSIRSASIRKEKSASSLNKGLEIVPKRLSGRGKSLRRLSTVPLRLIEEEFPTGHKSTRALSSNLSTPASRTPSRLKYSKVTSLSKPPSLRKTSVRISQNTKAKRISVLTKSNSKSSVRGLRASGSFTFNKCISTQKVKPGGKSLWFLAGAYLTVRSENGGYYLCRAINNVYNNSKIVKVRWLDRKIQKANSGVAVDENAFVLSYVDQINPHSILMQVTVEKMGMKFILNDHDKQETDRLLHIAEDVEAGKLAKDDVGEDVEEVIIIDTPVGKKRKFKESTTADQTKEKKPRLKKTESQKERDKVKRALARKEKKPRLKKTESQKERDKAKRALARKEKSKDGGEKRNRKAAIKEDDTTLHPNAKIPVLEKDPLWETTTQIPYVSKYANSRLAFRAIYLNDMKMLTKLLKDAERIKYLCYNRSLSCQVAPVQYAIELGNKAAYDLLFEDYFGSKYADRVKNSIPDKIMLNRLGTGSYNFRSLGIGRIRAIMASRGSREGNNALLKDKHDMEQDNSLSHEDLLMAAINAGASVELFKEIMMESQESGSYNYSLTQLFVRNLDILLTHGHNLTAGKLMEAILNEEYRQYSRFPRLIIKVLVSEDGEMRSLPPAQIKADAKELKGVTTIHAAACNPNPAVLDKVLSVDPDFHISDAKGRRPIHFAAGCSTSGPLKLLLDKGANPYDADSKGEIALHYAIQAGRTENVEILVKLQTDKDNHFIDPTEGMPNGGINRRNRQSESALHMAATKGNVEIVNLLLKHGASVDAELSISKFRITPLMLAAGKGHLDVVRCLVLGGAIVEKRDRLGRTALIHAAMNGSTNVLSYLLHIGASPDRADTSGNSPLHYAAAYGWYYCVQILLQAGANPSISNNWRTTPLSVAYLKGHIGIVTMLLDDSRVDVNFPDESGMTLLSIACSSDPEDGLIEQIQFLIKDKGADCKLVDVEGKTALHHLATANIIDVSPAVDNLPPKEVMNEQSIQNTISIAKLLIENGCDPSLQDKEGYSAAMRALEKINCQLAQYLVENGSKIFSSPSSNPTVPPTTLLHSLAYGLFNHGNPNLVIKFLTKMHTIKGEKRNFVEELCKMATVYDYKGFTPFLAACSTYSAKRFYNEANSQDYFREKWENARIFLKNLLEFAKSDVDAQSMPQWQEFDVPNISTKKYFDQSKAKWTPVFYLICCDPYWDNFGVYLPDRKCFALKYLLTRKPAVNVHSDSGLTPLIHAINEGNQAAVKLLLEDGKADANLCQLEEVMELDKKKSVKVPPVCCAAFKGQYSILEELLNHKADVSLMDEKNNTSVLHLLAQKRTEEGCLQAMEKVMDAGLDPNVLGVNKMTTLHLLVNNNSGRIDASFDAEILLLNRKADLSLCDDSGRIPLHYAFIKYGRETDTNYLDPVEMCKLLVQNMKQQDLSITDKFGYTPLHCAAMRGASICCMYLMQKGADPNCKDKIGNTPLALAIKSGHDSCGSVLIQNGSDLRSPVVYVDTPTDEMKDDDQSPIWRWKPLTAISEAEPSRNVPLFQEAIRKELIGVSFLILEWPIEKSGITRTDAIEMAIKNSQYNIVLRLLSTTFEAKELRAEREKKRNLLHVLALHSKANNSNSHLQIKVAQMLLDKGILINTPDEYKCTPLLYAVYNQNFELANFWSELPGVLSVKYVDSFSRSYLTAALWKNFLLTETTKVWNWIEKLVKKKADINGQFDYPLKENLFSLPNTSLKMPEPDYWKSYSDYRTTPLIVSLNFQQFFITQQFLKAGANPNQADNNSITPLMHAVKLNNLNHLKQLLNYDYDPSKNEDQAKKPQSNQVPRQGRGKVFRLKKMPSIIRTSESESSDEDEDVDENKEEEKTNEKVIETVVKTSSVNLNAVDKRGWTALHYAACSLSLGTYDNDEIVYVLVKAGAKTNIPDKDSQTPLDLALNNGAAKMAAMLQKLMQVAEKDMRKPSFKTFQCDDGLMWDTPERDFHSDAKKQLSGAEESMEEGTEYKAEVSQYCSVTNGVLSMDTEKGLPYEALMTKCEASLGVWGLYNFYQIQLVHQPGKELYVLFTRWGRIGDSGQYQHTPYQNKAEAVKEFCKVFREKSGNKWDDVKHFEQKPRKYRLVPLSERQPPAKIKEVHFDFKTSVRSELPESLQKPLKILMDVKTLEGDYKKNTLLDPDVLPFGRINREKLLQAKALLEEIGTHVNEIATYRKTHGAKTKEEKEKHQEDCQKVSELSSEYYQLIPQKNFVYEKLRPLDRIENYKEQFKLICNLLDFEVACKMLLGAMYCRNSINPMDYVYRCLKTKIQLMHEEDPMAQYILRYIYAGDQKVSVEAIYQLQREGEDERLQLSGIGNKRYLWHGTGVGNLISILHRGLVVTPLDASHSGALFGKGIYFSDHFCKSKAYCGCARPNTSNFILLCEVALGKQKNTLSFANNLNKDGYNSIFARGCRFPDPTHNVQLPTGVMIPLGEETREHYYKDPQTGQNMYVSLDFNEFIALEESQVCMRYLIQFH